MNLKIEEQKQSQIQENMDNPRDYEQMVQKLEAEVRTHIRVLFKLEPIIAQSIDRKPTN